MADTHQEMMAIPDALEANASTADVPTPNYTGTPPPDSNEHSTGGQHLVRLQPQLQQDNNKEGSPARPPTSPSANKRPQRRHGLECPFDLLQIIAITMYISFILGYIILYAPLMPNDTVILALSIVMGVLGVGSMLLYMGAARAEADDPLIHDKEEGERRADDLRYCTTCDCHVDPSTKHCMRCNKCVVGFDHHCRWLNNCVGSRNYKLFALFLGTTWTVMLVKVGVGIYMMVRYLAYRDDYNSKIALMYDTEDTEAQQSFFGLTVVLTVLAFIGFSLLSHLVAIHVLLSVDGITTYQRILNLRNEAVQEKNERDDAKIPEACWHASCHGLAMWCYTKGCAAPSNNGSGSETEATGASVSSPLGVGVMASSRLQSKVDGGAGGASIVIAGPEDKYAQHTNNAAIDLDHHTYGGGGGGGDYPPAAAGGRQADRMDGAIFARGGCGGGAVRTFDDDGNSNATSARAHMNSNGTAGGYGFGGASSARGGGTAALLTQSNSANNFTPTNADLVALHPNNVSVGGGGRGALNMTGLKIEMTPTPMPVDDTPTGIIVEQNNTTTANTNTSSGPSPAQNNRRGSSVPAAGVEHNPSRPLDMGEMEAAIDAAIPPQLTDASGAEGRPTEADHPAFNPDVAALDMTSPAAPPLE